MLQFFFSLCPPFLTACYATRTAHCCIYFQEICLRSTSKNAQLLTPHDIILNQNCSQIWLLTQTGSKKLEAQIHLIIVAPFPEPSICLSKLPVKHPPLGIPTGASLEGAALPITFCYVSFPEPSVTCLLNPSIKVLLIKKFHPSLKGSRKGASVMFPKTGLLLKQMPISTGLLGISFAVHSTVALPPGSPLRAPSLRGAVFPEPFLIHL